MAGRLRSGLVAASEQGKRLRNAFPSAVLFNPGVSWMTKGAGESLCNLDFVRIGDVGVAGSHGGGLMTKRSHDLSFCRAMHCEVGRMGMAEVVKAEVSDSGNL